MFVVSLLITNPFTDSKAATVALGPLSLQNLRFGIPMKLKKSKGAGYLSHAQPVAGTLLSAIRRVPFYMISVLLEAGS